MTYTPLWPDWAAQTRQALALVDEMPEGTRVALNDLGVFVGEELRTEFPDVEADLIGWITLRAASHLGGLMRASVNSGDHSPNTYAVIGMLAGDHLLDGAR